MLTRRRATALILVIGFGTGLAADAQGADKVWRVAVVAGALARSSEPILALEQRLAELGYVEGRNLVIHFRTAEGQVDRVPTLAAELVALRPDVLVAVSTFAGTAAKAATRTIPIVLAAVGDPVGTGLVPNLTQPGGNVTGVSLLNAELSGKGLQLLKEAVPAASRAAVLKNSRNPLHQGVMTAIKVAATTFKVGLDVHDLREPGDMPRIFEAITRQRADSLLVLPDSVSLAHRAPILDFARRRRLPAMYPFREYVDEGGLLCYGPNLVQNLREAAAYVDKILKGARPAVLPVSQATRFDLVVNLKTARVLGLSIPQAVQVRADELIQ